MHKFGVIICMLPRDYSAKLALFGKIAKSTGQEENRNGPNLLGLRCSHWASCCQNCLLASFDFDLLGRMG